MDRSKYSILKNDNQLAEKLKQFCDFEILQEKQNIYGQDFLKYNIEGIVFGINSNGHEYILLADNSIAFNDFDYGIRGRMAENLLEFFELIINIPEWIRYNYIGLYDDDKLLQEYIAKIEKENKIGKHQFEKIQKELCEKLSVKTYDKIYLLKRFCKSAIRDPKWNITYFDPNEYEMAPEKPPINEIKDIYKNSCYRYEKAGFVTKEYSLINPEKMNNERKYLGLQ